MGVDLINRALERATDTKACVIGDGVISQTAAMFKEQFPGAKRAIVVCDPRTKAAAGETVEKLLAKAGVAVSEYVLEPGGKTFHADYHYAAEVREAIKSAGVEKDGDTIVPVAAGSGVVNDLTKLAAGEIGIPYMVVATAAVMPLRSCRLRRSGAKVSLKNMSMAKPTIPAMQRKKLAKNGNNHDGVATVIEAS